MLHFVGFKGDEYNRARRVFGAPAFIHRLNDARFRQEFDPESDTVVFANGAEKNPKPFSYNDSEFF